MIYKGFIKSEVDMTRTGVVWVEIPDLGYLHPNLLAVQYVSPYFQPGKGGQFTPPCEGSQILVFINPANNRGYYLGTIVADEIDALLPNEEATSQPEVDPKRYYEDISPAVKEFKGNGGDGLEITSRKSTFRYVDRVRLNSGNKQILLDSSPESDCVKISNGNGDYIQLNNVAESSIGIPLFIEQSIEMMAHGGISLDADGGRIDIALNEGGDITLENTSTGAMSLNFPYGPRCGNINLFSKNKNIHLSCAAGAFVPTEGINSGGKIFIDTGNSELQVTRDAVTIRMNPLGTAPAADIRRPSIEVTPNGIYIDAGLLGAITLNGATINLNATDSINMQAPTVNTLGAASVNITSPANVNIDGVAALHLNSGLSLQGTGQATATITSNITPIPPVNITPSEYPLKTRFF